MKILGVQRIEFLVADPAAEAAKLGDALGLSLLRSETEAHGVVSYTDFSAGIELAGPAHEDSPLAGLLARQGEGFLTVVFRVESCDAVVAWARANGVEVLVDLEDVGAPERFSYYRQVSLSPEKFPAGASFTFAEYTER
jgi:hypothetical protein